MPITDIRMPAAGMNGTFFTCPDCYSTETRFLRAVSCQDDWRVEEMFVAEFCCSECGVHIRLRFVTDEGVMKVEETTAPCPGDGCPYFIGSFIESEDRYMPARPCRVCAHPAIAIINKGLAKGKTIRETVACFPSLRRNELIRHRAKGHIPPWLYPDRANSDPVTELRDNG